MALTWALASAASRNAGRHSLVPRKTPVRLTAQSRPHSARLTASISLPRNSPALLTRMSSLPKRPTAVAAAAFQSSSLVTSRWTYRAASPSKRATSRPRSSSTSPIATVAPASTISCAVSPPMPRAAPEIRATLPSSRFIARPPQAAPQPRHLGSRARGRREKPSSELYRSVFELHTFLHSRPRTDPLAPSLQMLQSGIVWERLAAGIDWVDSQVGRGDLVAGQILRLGKLLVGEAPQVDKPVLVKLDRRVRHLFRHARAKEEDGLIDRRVIGCTFGHPLKYPHPRDGVRRQEFSGLLAQIHQDCPRLGHRQRFSPWPVRVDKGRNPRSRVDLHVVGGPLLPLAQVEHMDLARSSTFIDRDRGALPVAGAGGVKLHMSPSLHLPRPS